MNVIINYIDIRIILYIHIHIRMNNFRNMNKHININNVNMGSTIGMMFVSAFSPTGGDDRGTSGHKGVRAAMRVAPASFKM